MRPFPYLLSILSVISMLAFTAYAEDVAAPWSIQPWVEKQAPAVQSQNQAFSLSGLERTDLPNAVHPYGRGPNTNCSNASNYSDLWVSNNGSFDRYSLAHQGDLLDLVAYVPQGGRADLYAISVSRGLVLHKGREVRPGYYKTAIQVGGPGRILALFSVDSQPSNALIIDILPEEEQPQGVIDVDGLRRGSAKVAIASDQLKGYDIYVDEAFYSSDGADGTIDGKASFVISGDRLHTIVVSTRGDRNHEPHRTEYINTFKSGYAYSLRI